MPFLDFSLPVDGDGNSRVVFLPSSLVALSGSGSSQRRGSDGTARLAKPFCGELDKARSIFCAEDGDLFAASCLCIGGRSEGS